MKPQNFVEESRQLGVVWYLIPLGWVAAALTAVFVMTHWPSAFSEAAAGATPHANEALSIMPGTGGESPVPSASSVFGDRSYEVVEHVEAF